MICKSAGRSDGVPMLTDSCAPILSQHKHRSVLCVMTYKRSYAPSPLDLDRQVTPAGLGSRRPWPNANQGPPYRFFSSPGSTAEMRGFSVLGSRLTPPSSLIALWVKRRWIITPSYYFVFGPMQASDHVLRGSSSGVHFSYPAPVLVAAMFRYFDIILTPVVPCSKARGLTHGKGTVPADTLDLVPCSDRLKFTDRVQNR